MHCWVSTAMGTHVGIIGVLLICMMTVWLGGVEAHFIGVDLGTEFVKITAPHGTQAIDIVLNEYSHRKTDHYIALHNDEWYIGDQAKALAARFPHKTITAVNHLVGLHKGAADAATYLAMRYVHDVRFGPRGTAMVHLSQAPEPFSAEELYAMMLSYLRKIATETGVSDPASVLITLPFHASMSERHAILDAATMAGLKVLGFMPATTAAALHYGTRRRGFANETVTLVVLDVGAAHAEAGLFVFTPPHPRAGLGEAFGTLTTVAVREARGLGGRALDLCLARAMEREAVRSLGIDPVLDDTSDEADDGNGSRANEAVRVQRRKARFALLRAANRARETLSANSATPYSIEGIAPGRDFHGSVTREAFEAACADVFTRLGELAASVLTGANRSVSQIDAFELMGGASRTPRLIADLAALRGKEADRTLNSDEAAAFGVGYYAARLSPFYRARSFRLREPVPHALYFVVQPALKEAQTPDLSRSSRSLRRLLLGDTDFVGEAVSVTLNRTDDFALQLYATPDTSDELPFAEIAVSGVRRVLERMRYFDPPIPHPNHTHLVRLQIHVNETGLPEVDEATVTVQFAAHAKKVGEDGVASDTSASQTTRPSPDTQSDTSPDSGDDDEDMDDSEGGMVKLRRRTMSVHHRLRWLHPVALTEAELAQSTRRLETIATHARMKRERAFAKNNLEAYLFWLRHDEELRTQLRDARVPPELVATIEANQAATRDWLESGDGDEETCATEMYVSRLRGLQASVEEMLQLLQTPSDPNPIEGVAGDTGSAVTPDTEHGEVSSSSSTTEEVIDDL